MTPLFITGIGTDVGKTLVATVLSAALKAHYWKPVQAGSLHDTDTDYVRKVLGAETCCHAESYRLMKAASPHIAAREENIRVDLDRIYDDFKKLPVAEYLVIEGAGGLLVPLNEADNVADLIVKLGARVILVSRNYLGSINHSLMTAEVCRSRNIDVAGWVFTDDYLHYEEEISNWTSLPVIGKIPFLQEITTPVILDIAEKIRGPLFAVLNTKPW